LINNKNKLKTIQTGTALLFEEPQVEANSRNWRDESNKMLSTLVSTFRNQRLVIFFTVPYLEFIDKQSRILFHAEFKALGFDKNTGITTIKPRFIEYNKKKDDFYRKMLIIKYAVEGKTYYGSQKLNKWHLNRPSDELTTAYETFKKQYTEALNKKMLGDMIKEEKREEYKDKYQELMRVKELYEKYGENYIKILQNMPQLAPFTLEKYIKFIKKSKKEELLENASI
jgi:hypothetical protein